MADQDQDRAPDQTPSTPNPDAKDSGLPKPSAPHPESDDKDDTSRIKLGSDKRDQPDGPDDTSRIKLEAEGGGGGGGGAPEGAADTANIDLRGKDDPQPDTQASGASESAAADDTSRIDLASAAGKSQTARIDLSTAKRATARPSSITRPSKTARIQLGGPKAKPKDTSRIPLEQATPPSDFSPKTSGIPSTDDPSEDTMRVDVEPAAGGKSKTARIELPKKPAQPTPTGRIKVAADEDDGEDVFKRRAAPAVPKPAAHKPAPAPLAEPEDEAPTAGVEPAPMEAAKSKTARIEMPADMVTPASARPKTIKIKRAETTPAHAPPVAATPEAKKSGVHKSKVKSKSKSKSSVSSPAVMVGSAAEEGPLATGLAAVAVVVIGILVYVLAAQTILPTLPFIGKIPV